MAGKSSPFNMERFFQALGDNTRLRLLNLMGDQAYLRRAGIVQARREGKWMHYRIVMPPNIGAAQVLHQTLVWLKEEKAMQADRARLSKACCTPAKFATLQGAPLPLPVSLEV
jgi:ArsR family transcriptional regulator